MNLLALALGPVIAIFFFIWAKDRYEREPLRRMILTAGIGAATAIPIVVVELLWGHTLDDIPKMAVNQLAFMAFVEIGLTEEFFKGLAFFTTAYWSKYMNEPYDGVVYSASAALGFAALENIIYVLSGGVGVAFIRAITAVPSHAMDGIIIGYFAGRAKFTSYPLFKPFLVLFGFGIAVGLHGLYDLIAFWASFHQALAFLWLIPLLGIMVLISLLMIRDARNRSPFKPAVDAQGRYTGYTVSGQPLPPEVAARIFKKEGYYPGWQAYKDTMRKSFLDEYLAKSSEKPKDEKASNENKENEE